MGYLKDNCKMPTSKNKILGLNIEALHYNKPNYLVHPTSCPGASHSSCPAYHTAGTDRLFYVVR